jgi:phenylacetate-CoA ligase
MNPLLLKTYHQLPESLRSVAASLHGIQLRRKRYGKETAALIEAARDREHWTAAEWQLWHESRLAYILHRAATCVPYYRERWAARRRAGDAAPWSQIENWPILEKHTLRRGSRAFIAGDCDRRRMDREYTSGTSGTPVELWRSRATARAWYALFEARGRLWYGVSRHSRWAILGGQLVAPVSQLKPPFWVWNAPLRQLYLSVYHLGRQFTGYYLDALQRYRIEYLLGYPSALEALAEAALRSGRPDIPLRVVIANAEPLFPWQREKIESAFGCAVRETYGMSEIVAAASECERGALHLWPEVGYIEFTPDGELIATSLLDADMPLVRYRTGDRGRLAVSSGCSCGRTLPVLASIEGRMDDVLVTPDGRQVGRLDPIFKAGLPIQEAQIIQERLDAIRIVYVPAEGFHAACARQLSELVRQRMGDVRVTLHPVARIPRGPNGKFRAVVSKLSAEERRVHAGE